VDAGVNFFDNADAYVQGRAEKLWQGPEEGCQSCILATKVAN
jgi:aryl-alcohol dehydrogenase-like predicted oxidoreductase